MTLSSVFVFSTRVMFDHPCLHNCSFRTIIQTAAVFSPPVCAFKGLHSCGGEKSAETVLMPVFSHVLKII